jgi:hypothetical protein
MNTLKIILRFSKAILTVLLCVTFVYSNSAVVIDFTRTNKGSTTGVVPGVPAVLCDVNRVWTCAFIGSDDDSYRSVTDVASAHINADGSVYLQEINPDTTVSVDDYWSVTLPAWYVSNGLTSYSLVGTDCTITIKPTVNAGSVTDWTLSVRGKATVTSGKDKDGKTTTTTTNTCGGPVDNVGKHGKSGKEKTGPSAKGPGPK